MAEDKTKAAVTPVTLEALDTKLDLALKALDAKSQSEVKVLEARCKALEGAVATCKSALETIEQLPNDQHLDRGPLARAALEVVAAL